MSDRATNAELTLVLEAAAAGDTGAASRVLPMVYDELRRMAGAQLGAGSGPSTLQPTALVHEAYIKLFGAGPADWRGRAHFFGAAARAMRQILVDHARRKFAEKRGGGRRPEQLDAGSPAAQGIADTIQPGNEQDEERLLALDEALRDLEREDARKVELVHLRYFAGLSGAQAAQVLGVSERTVEREWRFAKAWLLTAMQDRGRGGTPGPSGGTPPDAR